MRIRHTNESARAGRERGGHARRGSDSGDCSARHEKNMKRVPIKKMCLRAVIMLQYVRTCGAGRQTRRMASEPGCRPENLGSWSPGCMPNGCLAFMAIIFARRAGRQRGAWSGSSRSPAALQVSAAQRPRSPRAPPPAPSLVLHAACQEGPGRAQACSRAGHEQGRPGREARPGGSSPRAPLRPPRHLYPRPAGPPRSATPRLAPAPGTFQILIFFVDVPLLPPPKPPTSPSCPSWHCPDGRVAPS